MVLICSYEKCNYWIRCYGLSTAIELIIEGMDVIIIDSNNEDIASRNALENRPIFKGSGSYMATKDNNSAQRPKDQRQFAFKSFNLHIEYYENTTRH